MENSPELPANFRLQYTAVDIAGQIRRLGAEITLWAGEVRCASHTDILAIPILRGGIFFFADLVREIKYSVEMSPARAWAYQQAPGVMRPEVTFALQDVPARGRAVLLVDDICDSGRTLHLLKEAMLSLGARTVRSAVLSKRVLAKETFEPDWVGFKYTGPEWFVGYGMEDNDRWRNLGSIYVIGQG
jgi:hypoxanthine phosphoribosyltransferase